MTSIELKNKSTVDIDIYAMLVEHRLRKYLTSGGFKIRDGDINKYSRVNCNDTQYSKFMYIDFDTIVIHNNEDLIQISENSAQSFCLRYFFITANNCGDLMKYVKYFDFSDYKELKDKIWQILLAVDRYFSTSDKEERLRAIELKTVVGIFIFTKDGEFNANGECVLTIHMF